MLGYSSKVVTGPVHVAGGKHVFKFILISMVIPLPRRTLFIRALDLSQVVGGKFRAGHYHLFLLCLSIYLSVYLFTVLVLLLLISYDFFALACFVLSACHPAFTVVGSCSTPAALLITAEVTLKESICIVEGDKVYAPAAGLTNWPVSVEPDARVRV
jgi:hypothetical protein